MHSLTPPLILENLAAGRQSGRFPAVVLFVDTSGFTALTVDLMAHDKEGAEVLADVLAAVFTPLIAHVYSQGGFVAGFAGDAFKAIFPLADGDAHVRALAAAQQICAQMAAHTRYTTGLGSFEFAVRAILADGDVTWDIWSSDEQVRQSHAYTFAGPAIDQAVVGEDYAEAGQVIMTASVLAVLQQRLSAQLVTAPVTAEYFLLHTLVAALPAPSPAIQTESVAVASAQHFFPRDLLTMGVQGEFRQVVSVFLNVEMLPAPAADDAFMPTVFHLLHRYGGYLCRIGRIGAGDAGGTLLCFWGAPASYENNVERALNFILDLRAQSVLPLRAGITYQMAYAGFIGSPLREEYTCYGASVNLAARQMAAAGWGDIFLDAETARRAAEFDILLAGHFAFKGYATEQPVFLLQGRRETTGLSAFSDELVGRGDALAQLQATIQSLLSGPSGGAIVVVGEAGIGKSHLLYELRRRLTTRRYLGEISAATMQRDAVGLSSPPVVQWFHCPADEILRQPLNPFRHLLRRYFAQSRDRDDSENKVTFDQILDALIAQTSDPALRQELERTRSFLGGLVDLFWTDSLYARVEPRLRFENTLEALRIFLLAESRRHPLVLELEDLHWLDEDSQRFLLRLAPTIGEEPLILLASSREEPRAGLFVAHLLPTIIRLEGLPLPAIQRLSEARLARPVAPVLLDLLLQQSGGNPFFAEQILLYLQEEGLLGEDEAGLTSRTASTILPADVQTVLVARLDRLTQSVKEVVQTAAVLGREFEVRVLSQMLRNPGEIESSLQAAATGAIWTALSELRYLFRHTLLREAAYEMQLRARLRVLHRTAAEAIEIVYAADLAPHYASLVYHFRLAQQVDRERHYAGLAAAASAEQFANAEAVAYYSRALELTPEDEYTLRLDYCLAREKLYDVLGDRNRQREELAALNDLAVRLGDSTRLAEVALRQAVFADLTGDYETAIAAVQQVIELAQDQPMVTARAYFQWGVVLTRLGKYLEAQHQVAFALHLAQRGDLEWQEASCLHQLGILVFYQGDYTAAQHYFEEALSIFQRRRDFIDEGKVLNSLSILMRVQGHFEESNNYLAACLRIARTAGYKRGECLANGGMGSNHLLQGDYYRASEHYKQSLHLAREIGDPEAISDTIFNLALVASRVGDYATARVRLDEALDLKRAIGHRHGEGKTLAALGGLLLGLGDASAARHYLEQSLEIAQALGGRSEQGDALGSLGRVYLALGMFEEAEHVYQQAMQIRSDLGQRSMYIAYVAASIELALARGDLTSIQSRLDEVLAHLELHATEGIYDPFRVYEICYRAGVALQDPRTQTILTTAYHRLQEAAVRISDVAMRQSFLENVAAHCELVQAFKASNE